MIRLLGVFYHSFRDLELREIPLLLSFPDGLNHHLGELVLNMQQTGYRVQPFPGCTSSVADYLAWLDSRRWPEPICSAE